MLSPHSQEQPAPDRTLAREAGKAPPISPPAQPDKRWLRAFSSLRHRNFRLYWFGEMVSVIGSWMQSIGQAWLALELTHSAWQLGLVGALQSLPVLLLTLFGGVFADRWPKRRVLLVTQSVAMAQALILWALIASGVIQMWHLYALALLLGLTNSLNKPTRQAFVVEMVGRADLTNAVALDSSLTTLARIVGPSLGGVVIATYGVSDLFLFNGLSFLAVIAGLALINIRELHAQPRHNAGERQSAWQSLREGMDYVRTSPAVMLLLIVVGLVLLFGSNFNVALPLIATDVLHIGASGFGFLSAAIGAGSLLAALWMAWGNRRPTIRRVLASALAFSILEAAFAVSRSYPLSLALIASLGFAEITFAEVAITALQTTTPDHLRGRVMSVCVLFFDGSLPLGYLLVGWLSSRYGVVSALLICAALCLVVVAVGWLRRKPAEKAMAELATV